MVLINFSKFLSGCDSKETQTSWTHNKSNFSYTKLQNIETLMWIKSKSRTALKLILFYKLWTKQNKTVCVYSYKLFM